MKDRIRLSAALLSIVASAVCFCVYSKDGAEARTRPQEPEKSAAAPQQPANYGSAQPDASEGDALYGPSFASTAWILFMYAMTPTNGSPTFETWTEQCELNPNAIGCPSAAAAGKTGGNGKMRLLHGSPLAQKMAGSDCSAMSTAPVWGYPPPSNLAPSAMFCEEVFVSPPEADFLKSKGLTTLAGQQAYGKLRNGLINFPGTGTNELPQRS